MGSEMCIRDSAGNEPAIHLYERSGFTRMGIRKGFYEQPVEDAVIMVKG